MLNHEELISQWAADSKLDQTDLKAAMYQHPMIHSKYLGQLQQYKIQLRKHLLKYQKQKLFKQRYYNGELTKEELITANLKQYLFKRPMKAEMEALLDADSELQTLQEQAVYIETLVSTAESIMKDISNRYYLFKTLVDYEKFQAGV